MSIIFDGGNDYIDIGDEASLNAASAFTVMSWIILFGTSNYPCVVSKCDGDGVTHGFRLQMSLETLYPRFLVACSAGNKSLVSSVAINRDLGDQFHLAAVFSTTSMEIFVDGASGGTLGYSATNMKLTDNPFIIGNNNQATISHPWSGRQEDVRYYDRALTAAEIATIVASRGRDGIFDGLIGRWLLAEKNSGAVASGAGTLIDSMGLSNGTPYGSPVYGESELSFRRFV